jgi:hypothetical protein
MKKAWTGLDMIKVSRTIVVETTIKQNQAVSNQAISVDGNIRNLTRGMGRNMWSWLIGRVDAA